MQRGLDAEAKKQLEEDEKRIISDEHWYLDRPELNAKEYVSTGHIQFSQVSLMLLPSPKTAGDWDTADHQATAITLI